MSTTTHRIPIFANKWVNVSNGNTNCTLVVPTGVVLRVHVGGSEPVADEVAYARVSGPGTSGARSGVVTAMDLEAEADLWVRGDTNNGEVTVIRGPGSIMIANGG